MEYFLLSPSILLAIAAVDAILLAFLFKMRMRHSRLLRKRGLSPAERHSFFYTRKSRKLIFFLLLMMSVILAALGARLAFMGPAALNFIGGALFVFSLYLFAALAEASFSEEQPPNFDFVVTPGESI